MTGPAVIGRDIFRKEYWMWRVDFMVFSVAGSYSTDSSCIENTSERSTAACLECKLAALNICRN